MEKVAERLMYYYNQLPKDAKILLVFSINGQKSYCGLAEMAGAYRKADMDVEGFKVKKDGNSKSFG